MAQRTNPAAVSFEADGKTYTLLCDMNALIDFEAEFGVSAMELLSDDLSALSLIHMRGLFWVMLKEYHPDIDQRGAGRLMLHAKEKMAEAIKAAFPAPAEDSDAGKAKARSRKAR